MIDTREDLDFSEVSTNCPDGQVIKSGMAKFLQSAIKPNQKNEFKTCSKEVSAGNWIARKSNYTWPDPKPLVNDTADDDEDYAGQHTLFLSSKYFCDLDSAHVSWQLGSCELALHSNV